MASKRRNMFHKNKTQETTEKDCQKGLECGNEEAGQNMADTKINMADNRPAVCVGTMDLNTSSTIELTGVIYEVNKHDTEKNGKSGRTENPQATSDLDALLHVVKSSLGTGVLASAEGFKNAGILVGIFGTILVGIICTHCTHIMVQCSQEMCSLLKKPSMGYGETIEEALKNSTSKTFRKYAKLAKVTAGGFMFFTYYGVTTVYVLLVAESFKQIFETHIEVEWNIRIYILMVAIPIFLVGMIRSMKYLVPFSAIANTCLILGLCLTFYFVLQDIPPISERELYVSPKRYPLFFATVLFGMEGIGTMLPIENSMRKPHHFLGCPGVLNFSMSIVISLFLFVGLFGYLKYGDAALGSITLNLNNDIFSEIVKGLVALAILFSYGLQLTAAIDVLWRCVHSLFPSNYQTTSYYLMRGVLICSTVAIAAAVPNLGPIISLIGAVGFSTCGFFFPALAETAIRINKNMGKWNWVLWKNVLLVLITILAVVSGSIVSISDIIAQYS